MLKKYLLIPTLLYSARQKLTQMFENTKYRNTK